MYSILPNFFEIFLIIKEWWICKEIFTSFATISAFDLHYICIQNFIFKFIYVALIFHCLGKVNFILLYDLFQCCWIWFGYRGLLSLCLPWKLTYDFPFCSGLIQLCYQCLLSFIEWRWKHHYPSYFIGSFDEYRLVYRIIWQIFSVLRVCSLYDFYYCFNLIIL